MKVGSLVICINDANIDPRIENRPKKDAIYTVRAVIHNFLAGGQKGLLLEELVNAHLPHPSGLGTFEPNFSINRFSDLGIPDKDFEKELKSFSIVIKSPNVLNN